MRPSFLRTFQHFRVWAHWHNYPNVSAYLKTPTGSVGVIHYTPVAPQIKKTRLRLTSALGRQLKLACCLFTEHAHGPVCVSVFVSVFTRERLQSDTTRHQCAPTAGRGPGGNTLFALHGPFDVTSAKRGVKRSPVDRSGKFAVGVCEHELVLHVRGVCVWEKESERKGGRERESAPWRL